MTEDNVTRRVFFAQLGASAVDAAAGSVRAAQNLLGDTVAGAAGDAALPWLRPPGALAEHEFLARCTRCDACIAACPYMSIRRLGPEFGPDAGTPAVIPAETPCYLCRDMPCIPACEPGALQPTPRNHVTMGLAVIRLSECYVAQGQPCDYCLVKCPLGSDAIRCDTRGLPTIIRDGCAGCGVCAHLCPPGAISIGPHSALAMKRAR